MPRGSGFGSNTAARIVRTIWQNPRISRVDIAERLGLDKSTVSNQVARLIDIGLVEELDEGLSSTRGGRRPIHLSIKSSYGKVIGIEIHVDSYIAVAVDLAGSILGEKRGRISTLRQDCAGAMLEVVNRCIQGLCPGGRNLLGVGIGIGGLVDAEKGRIRYSVPLGVDTSVDIAGAVASLTVPCRIENDANCCAWGELAFNRSESLRNFLFSLVEFRRDPRSIDQSGGIGVGFGIVLGGRVYSGSHGKAGEFRSVLCEGPGRSQLSLAASDLVRFDSDRQVLAAAADELARNIAMLANTMDFERIYIGGDIENLDVDFPAMLRRRLAENWMYPAVSAEIDVRYSSLGNKAVAYGAAGMMLNRLISEEPILVSKALDLRK
jgi:predicted NBD/HSP70 family sugar kinase